MSWLLIDTQKPLLPVTMSEKKTRHLAAIMFTDIAGYTKLMQESESRAAQVRQRHREVFERYHEQFNGQILQYYGDGSLSIFSSCVEAVRCATLIQQELQKDPKVPLRIGIHLGDIVKDQNDIYGDGVNVASRIESLGVPGTVLISGEVRKQIKNHEIETVPMGRFAMKNVAAPVEVFTIRADGLNVPKGRDLKGKAKRLNSTSFTLANTSKWIRLAAIGFVAMALGATLFWTLIGGQVNSGKTSTELTVEERIKWAYQIAIPKLEALVNNLYIHQKNAGYGPDAWEAFFLAQQVEKVLPDDPKVLELKSKCSKKISIYSSPQGAKVYAKGYSQADTAFQLMGTTPIENISFPSSYVNLKLEKEGYGITQDVIFINEIFDSKWSYKLDKLSSIPKNMSMVRPHIDTLLFSYGLSRLLQSPDEYLIDKYEVSNKEYLEFVKAGGYRKPEYWKEPFIKDGKKLSWEEAVSLFVDQTALQGPSTWIGGSYPEGEDNFPVEGVSWYEAVAYARFVGKQLPSIDHLKYLTGATFWVAQEMLENSHLNAKHARERSYERGLNLWAVHDIFGNVREWCYNTVNNDLRSIIGAAYNDEDYMTFHFNYAKQPFDRSPGNGFRCMQSTKFPPYSSPLYQPFKSSEWRNYYEESPVSDEVFKSYLNFFAYDKQKMNPIVIDTLEEAHWIREKIEFEAPYEEERMLAYLFLPKNTIPPYQTLIYWPGATALNMTSSEGFLEIGQIDFFIKNGRALIYPIYAGTYERQKSIQRGCEDMEICHRNNNIKQVQEALKSIDYLETRSDIDIENLAFLGKSWGGFLGIMPMALDKRIKAGIFHLGGLAGSGRFPEVDVYNYCFRVNQPTIMLNGKYDVIRPYEKSVKPMYDFLGTPPKDKHLRLFPEAHMAPKKEFIKESLFFLDKYFGKVEYLSN